MNRDILIYQNQDGNIKIDVRLQEETVWLTQDQMATLFGKAKSTINKHIKNIYDEQEVIESATISRLEQAGRYKICLESRTDNSLGRTRLSAS